MNSFLALLFVGPDIVFAWIKFKTYTVVFTVKFPRFSTSEYTGDFTLENSSLVLTGIWFSVPGFAVLSGPFVKRNNISKVVLKTYVPFMTLLPLIVKKSVIFRC